MDDLLSEKEQLEQMRAWWSEYGRYVIAGVVIAVGLLVGWNQYKSKKLEAQVAASVLYESLTEYVSDGDLDEAEAVADELATNYVKTSYSAQSKLAMARLYMDKNRDQDAADVLNELLVLPGNNELKQIGRLRLARILLYQDKAQDVVDLLQDQNNPAFAALSSEMLGDAYSSLGRIAEAGDAYRNALADPASTPTVNRGLVQMKLVDLPEVTESEPAAVPDADAIDALSPDDDVLESAAEAILDDATSESGDAE